MGKEQKYFIVWESIPPIYSEISYSGTSEEEALDAMEESRCDIYTKIVFSLNQKNGLEISVKTVDAEWKIIEKERSFNIPKKEREGLTSFLNRFIN